MQSPGTHVIGKTHTSVVPCVQLVFDVHVLPPTEHVPEEHCDDAVQMLPVPPQRPKQSASR